MNRRKSHLKLKSVMTLIILSGLLISACSAIPSDTASPGTEGSSETTTVSETTIETSASSETSATTVAATTVTSETDLTDSSDPDILSSGESSEETDSDIGYGSYGFQKGDKILHSQNDISMLVAPEDTTIYDHEARNIPCYWIDIFYVEDSFDMTVYDYTYRFLSFYNMDTSLAFSGHTKIGTWKTPKGSNLDLYIAEISIISDNLEIKLLPKEPGKPENYKVSVNGRGYYVSEEQLQMADFVLSSLKENPGVDPLEGIITGADHTYYF